MGGCRRKEVSASRVNLAGAESQVEASPEEGEKEANGPLRGLRYLLV